MQIDNYDHLIETLTEEGLIIAESNDINIAYMHAPTKRTPVGYIGLMHDEDGNLVEYELLYKDIHKLNIKDPIAYIHENIQKKLHTRCKEMLFNSPEKIIKLLEQHPNATLTQQDSFAVGNCRKGTLEFIRKFKLPVDGIRIADLLKHPKLDEMLNDYAFRKVIINKFTDKETRKCMELL